MKIEQKEATGEQSLLNIKLGDKYNENGYLDYLVRLVTCLLTLFKTKANKITSIDKKVYKLY